MTPRALLPLAVAFACAGTLAGGTPAAAEGDGPVLVFVDARTSADIFLAQADGSRVRRWVTGHPWATGPDISPDGSKVAYSEGTYIDSTLVIATIDGRASIRLSFPTQVAVDPAWSPDVAESPSQAAQATATSSSSTQTVGG